MSTRQFLIKKNLLLRAKIFQAIRNFFIKNLFLEVETPLLISAPAPEANIDAIPSGKLFLHTSPELCMKRLLSAGYSRIFQICKCFRANERGDRHLPEFTILEWYCSEIDYFKMMEQCENLVISIADDIFQKKTVFFREMNINLEKPWDRLSVFEAFEKYSPIPLEKALSENKFDEIIAFEIEPRLGIKKPVFLYDYPASKGALARLKQNNHSIAERFELYIGGVELCNAFSELTDNNEQRKRFEQENLDRLQSGKHAYPMPESFLQSLAFMPRASGIALGLDRLVMIFTNSQIIDDVNAFTPEEV